MNLDLGSIASTLLGSSSLNGIANSTGVSKKDDGTYPDELCGLLPPLN